MRCRFPKLGFSRGEGEAFALNQISIGIETDEDEVAIIRH